MLEIWAHQRNVEGQPVVKTLIWDLGKKTSNYSFVPYLPSPFSPQDGQKSRTSNNRLNSVTKWLSKIQCE